MLTFELLINSKNTYLDKVMSVSPRLEKNVSFGWLQKLSKINIFQISITIKRLCASNPLIVIPYGISYSSFLEGLFLSSFFKSLTLISSFILVTTKATKLPKIIKLAKIPEYIATFAIIQPPTYYLKL